MYCYKREVIPANNKGEEAVKRYNKPLYEGTHSRDREIDSPISHITNANTYIHCLSVYINPVISKV